MCHIHRGSVKPTGALTRVEISSVVKYQENSKRDLTRLFFYPQACFLHWTYWNLPGAVASPACSAPQRHWKITLSSLCSQGIKAAALLSQNRALCCSDSTSLGLISPGVSLHVLAHITQVAEPLNLCPIDSFFLMTDVQNVFPLFSADFARFFCTW